MLIPKPSALGLHSSASTYSHFYPSLGARFSVLTYAACATVLTGLMLAVVEGDLTVGASGTGGTGARVRPLPSVGARRSILAWGVVRAVVEVCKRGIRVC